VQPFKSLAAAGALQLVEGDKVAREPIRTVQEILMSHVVGEPTGASLAICGRRNERLGPPFV
jgi:hypothetical protein